MTNIRPAGDILTTGYLVVDILDTPAGLRHSAGGTAGNVACILAWLGMRAAVLARIGDDTAGRFLLADLARADVDTSNVRLDGSIETPLLVHQVTEHTDHKFLFSCSRCGRRLPPYRAPLAAQVSKTVLGTPDALFLDRAGAAALTVAERVIDRGGLVLFEPNFIDRRAAFERAAALAHIVKVSVDLLPRLSFLVASARPSQIQIVTLGSRGLRYRIGVGKWHQQGAYPANAVDAGGAGDWLTSGLIAYLMRANSLNDRSVATGLKIGQAIAAISCRELGARGLTSFPPAAILDEVRRLAGIDPGWVTGRSCPEGELVASDTACVACLSAVTRGPVINKQEAPADPPTTSNALDEPPGRWADE